MRVRRRRRSARRDLRPLVSCPVATQYVSAAETSRTGSETALPRSCPDRRPRSPRSSWSSCTAKSRNHRRFWVAPRQVCCATHERKKLEHLCRYITRLAIPNERLTLNRAGDVVLQLKSPYHHGTTHIVMSPLEFMQRLAALVPRPRLHLIRFHGVLAPNATLRPEIIPGSGRQAGNPLCAWLPERAGQHQYPLSRQRRGAPCRGAGAPELETSPHPRNIPHPGPTRVIDNPRVHPYSSPCRKRAFEIPMPGVNRGNRLPANTR
ncbi:MAG: transposase [Gammaproteobacteria bacterium]